jgi:hypothetical protein
MQLRVKVTDQPVNFTETVVASIRKRQRQLQN